LRRVIRKYIEEPLSEAVIAGEVTDNSHVIADIDVEKEKVVFKKSKETLPAL